MENINKHINHLHCELLIIKAQVNVNEKFNETAQWIRTQDLQPSSNCEQKCLQYQPLGDVDDEKLPQQIQIPNSSEFLPPIAECEGDCEICNQLFLQQREQVRQFSKGGRPFSCFSREVLNKKMVDMYLNRTPE